VTNHYVSKGACLIAVLHGSDSIQPSYVYMYKVFAWPAGSFRRDLFVVFLGLDAKVLIGRRKAETMGVILEAR
jgi:hypothetical protein